MEKNFKTKDLYEASLCIAEGMTLDRMEKVGNVCWFIFVEQKSCEDLMTAYWNGQALTNARAYANAIRNLKDMIFAKE